MFECFEALLCRQLDVANVFRCDEEYRVLFRPCETGDALSCRERESLELLVRGQSRKEAAHELGLRTEAFCNGTRSALYKLGIRSVERVILAAAALERGSELEWEESAVHVAGEPTDTGSKLMGRRLALDEQLLGRLSRAERHVALLIVDGLSNAEIGQRRSGSSTRTVANQVAAVFHKVEVHSRVELVRALALPSSRTRARRRSAAAPSLFASAQ
jgi:DNA-binding NarL/FixJ family response regulator